ncbi:MAG: hypothetical protein Q8934_11735 [Bacillota bacterium]|nr:hypothetical protein [Bacillota bacterium]
MGHDISGINNAEKVIAYARFSMWNDDASILYSLLDAEHFDAGVSGIGDMSTFSIQQIEKALNTYNQLYVSESDFLDWDRKQILNFIQNCLATAQKEGSVRVYFG